MKSFCFGLVKSRYSWEATPHSLGDIHLDHCLTIVVLFLLETFFRKSEPHQETILLIICSWALSIIFEIALDKVVSDGYVRYIPVGSKPRSESSIHIAIILHHLKSWNLDKSLLRHIFSMRNLQENQFISSFPLCSYFRQSTGTVPVMDSAIEIQQ